MGAMDREEWRIERLPFVWRTLPRPDDLHGLPATLPFTLTYDARTGLVRQGPSEEVRRYLEAAYSAGSVITGNAQPEGLGREVADEFLAFVDRDVRDGERPRSVLEVGCGSAYLLSEMRRRHGATVLGVEPGPQGAAGGIRFGVPVVQGFFPNPAVQGTFSAIVIMNVLEHVPDPVEFLRQLRRHLDASGALYVAVPNEEPYITTGDVSTLFHEHWSFFDRRTLASTVRRAGLAIHSQELSVGQGSIYLVARPDGPGAGDEEIEVEEATKRARRYLRLGREHTARLGAFCEARTRDGRSLAIFVPGRFVNAQAIHGLSTSGLRYVDDDPGLRGTYFPGIDIPIESRADLLARPPDGILIMSRTFGERIAGDLRRSLPATTEVHTVAGLLDGRTS